MSANELLKIKDALNTKVREQDKLLGRKETLLEQLNKLGCKTFDEAEVAINKLEKEIDIAEKTFLDNLEEFKEKYGTLL